ncbi:MAG: hypothetical protein AB1649_05820 [Chloroflexota bacterium]
MGVIVGVIVGVSVAVGEIVGASVSVGVGEIVGVSVAVGVGEIVGVIVGSYVGVGSSIGSWAWNDVTNDMTIETKISPNPNRLETTSKLGSKAGILIAVPWIPFPPSSHIRSMALPVIAMIVGTLNLSS